MGKDDSRVIPDTEPHLPLAVLSDALMTQLPW